jgi:tape measure domain-containing protein
MTKNEVKILLTAINGASAELEKAKKDIEGLGTEADKASKGGLAAIDKKLRDANDASRTFAAGIALVGAAIAATVGTGIKLAADQEQAQIAFTNMLGSAEEAKDFLEGLADFAANTPFEMHGLRDASKLLLAFGFQAKDILPIMTSVGDAVAAVGGGEFEIQRVVRALGQMQAKGKVSAEEMMQLAELGIPAWQLLADKIGVSIPEAMKLAEKGVITGAEGIEAIVDGLEEKFGGMMQAQSQTLAGLFSTLKDEASLTLMAIGQDLVEAFNVDDLLRDAIEAVHSIREAVEAEGLVGLLEEHRVAIIIVAGAITGALIPAFYSMAAAAVAAAVALAPFLIGGAVIAGIIALQTELAKSDSWDTFVSNANRSKEAIEGLTKVTTEQGLIEAAELLSSILKGKAKEGFDQFFNDTIRQVLAQEGLQAALLLTKQYSAEMLAQANADAAKAQNAILTAEIYQAQSDLNAAKALDKIIPNDANIAKYEARIASLREQQLATIPVIAAYHDTNADLEGGLIDSATATERWIDSLVNFKATALETGPTIAELPFLQTGENAEDAATQINNVADSTRTLQDVFDLLSDSGTQADKRMAALGNTLEAQLENAQTKVRLFDKALNEALELGASQAEIDYLAEKLGEAQRSLEDIKSNLTEIDVTVKIGVEVDTEKAKAMLEYQIQKTVDDALSSLGLDEKNQSQTADVVTEQRAQAESARQAAEGYDDFARSMSNLNEQSRLTLELIAQQDAEFQIWLNSLRNGADIMSQLAGATEMAENQREQAETAAQAAAAYDDFATQLARLNEQSRIALELQQSTPKPAGFIPDQGQGGYFDDISGEAIESGTQTVLEYTNALLENLELKREYIAISNNEYVATLENQQAGLEHLIGITAKGSDEWLEYKQALDEVKDALAGITKEQRKQQDFSSDLAGGFGAEPVEETNNALEDTINIIGGVLDISRAIGDSFDGEFGKAADAIAETAEVALNAVKAIASGDPIAIAAAAIQAIGFIASEIAEATKDNIKAAAEEIDAQYELIGEATAKGLAEANKKKETRYFLFIPYQVEVPDQPALDAAVQITNTFAQGLLDGLGGTEEDFQKWLDDWIDQLILQSIIAAQDLSEITKAIQDALADDGIIDENERKRIQGMADSIRDSVIAAAEGAGITFDKDVDGSLAAWRKELQKLRDQLDQTEVGTADFNDLLRQIEELENRIAAATGKANNPSDPKPSDSSQEMDFSNIPPAIQFAVATPLVEAANTFLFGVDKLIDFLDGEMTIAGGSADLDSFATSITRFDNATIRFEDSVDRWVDEGLRIMLEYPDDRQTETPRSLTRSFRSR